MTIECQLHREHPVQLSQRLRSQCQHDLVFPKTAVVSSYRMSMFDWTNNSIANTGDDLGGAEDIGEILVIPDGTLWKADVGLRGRMTRKLVGFHPRLRQRSL